MAVPDSQYTRLKRSYASLEGLSTGDAFGERFFTQTEIALTMIRERALPNPPWYFIDDTNMALSIMSVLRQYGEINQDMLARSFAERYSPMRGYGPAMHGLLEYIRLGKSWKALAEGLFGGTGSYGNGGAMRIAPLGAYFADDIDTVVEQARKATEVTHAHPEAIAGAIAIAVGAAYAWQLRDSPPPDRKTFLDAILPHVPDSLVRAKIVHARDLAPGASVTLAASALGSGNQITAQDTVPFALWCAGGMLNNYEEAIWLTVSGLGDRDTTCAMVGGIVAAYTGADNIPSLWLQYREPLPRWAFKETL